MNSNDVHHELSISELLDIVSRTISVMREQRDENGELFAEPNAELFAELQSLDGYLRDCSMTAGEVTFRR